MKQAGDAKGGKCRPIKPDQRPLQLFPSVQVDPSHTLRRSHPRQHYRCGSFMLSILALPTDIALKARPRVLQSIFKDRAETRGNRDGSPKIRTTRAGRGAVHQASTLPPCFPLQHIRMLRAVTQPLSTGPERSGLRLRHKHSGKHDLCDSPGTAGVARADLVRC